MKYIIIGRTLSISTTGPPRCANGCQKPRYTTTEEDIPEDEILQRALVM